MARIDLHKQLLSIVPSGWKVYYQPPGNLSYPCIVYGRDAIDAKYADDMVYVGKRAYNVQVISRDPDCTLAETIMQTIPGCKSNGVTIVDNLYHDNLTIYY